MLSFRTMLRYRSTKTALKTWVLASVSGQRAHEISHLIKYSAYVFTMSVYWYKHFYIYMVTGWWYQNKASRLLSVARCSSFLTPVVEHWLEQKQLNGSIMKDWSEDPLHHKRTLHHRATSCFYTKTATRYTHSGNDILNKKIY